MITNHGKIMSIFAELSP